MTMIGPRNFREFFTGSVPGVVTLLMLVSIVAACLVAYFIPLSPTDEKITLTKTQLDEIKADAYTAGHIDGRASVLDENMDRHCPLGVPEGYEPSPWPEWRKYATVISSTPSGCE